ncbi:hypothetical protein AU381_05935 [Sinorhizobium glycinis]|uniref:Uncharacterized protein n=1 Tax=Sinorhizobium glycinis TaxID=1472378 RepID=A0A178Y233_9HYPH|nr:hypothetical protein [Sinorhizobium glycinis]OAP41404.1 hypothetical protein AU381_05935 [Sinorhizobium glycinis]
MPIPIGTIRNASAPGDDAVQIVRRVLLPSGPRTEAIQKLLDMLGRHLSGKEVLPRDALVRLMEDIARVLKFSPLPQETGRAFTRRLVEAVESLPLPERLVIEKQLGGGSLARRLAALTRGGPSTGAVSTVPLPAGHTGIRNLPLQLPVAQHLGAAQTPPPSDLALLQAMLRKTYGADDGDAAELTLHDTSQATEPGEPTRAAPQRAQDRVTQPAQSPPGNGDVAATTASVRAAEDGVEAAEAMPPALPDTSDSVGATAAAGDEALPAGFEGGEAAGPQQSAEMPDNGPDQTFGEAETATMLGSARDADAFETDGTYGPTRAGGDRRLPAQAAVVREAFPEPSLADAAELLLQGSLDLPDIMAEDRRVRVPRGAEREPVPTRSAPAAPGPDGARRDNAAADSQPIAEPIASEKTERPSAGTPVVERRAPAGEDVAMRQAIALLVEGGLPEIIPFAMVPYLPAQEEADDGRDTADRSRRDDNQGGAGTDPEDRKEEKEGQDPEGGGDDADDPEASDSYDLYSKLGGLG